MPSGRTLEDKSIGHRKSAAWVSFSVSAPFGRKQVQGFGYGALPSELSTPSIRVVSLFGDSKTVWSSDG
jgi:hypothetical protein